MLVIRDTSSVPDGGWRYPGLNGFTVTTRSYPSLFEEVRKHYTSNGQEPPDEQTIIDHLCQELAVPCYETETRQPLVNKFVTGLPVQAPRGCCGQKKE